MNASSNLGVIVFCSLCAAGEAAERSRATPWFSRLDDGPAFLVECKNESPEPIKWGHYVAAEAVRVDGTLHEGRGIVGSFMGVPDTIGPGQSWRAIVILDQSGGKRPTRSAVFGAFVRSPWSVPVGGGLHHASFRCGDTWSPEIAFYWEE